MPASRRSTPAKRARRCPECGSGGATPIVYGMPDLELAEKARAGSVILGGCLVDGNDPRFHCKDCGTDFA